MKITCTDYTGFKQVVAELSATSEVFYQGDASSTVTSYIIGYNNAAPYNVVVFENSGGVLISTVTADYAGAVRIPGLSNVEI